MFRGAGPAARRLLLATATATSTAAAVGWWGGVAVQDTPQVRPCRLAFRIHAKRRSCPATPPPLDRVMCADGEEVKKKPTLCVGFFCAADHGYAGRPDRHPAGRRRRRWQRLLLLPSALPLFLFHYAGGGHRNLSWVGRWGCAGALSAMDGAKRGPHGCGLCRPPRSPTARPTSAAARTQLQLEPSHPRGASPLDPPFIQS